MNRRINYLPAIIMLLAAFMASVFTIIYKYELLESMIIILVSAIVFYILGRIIKWLICAFLIIKEEPKKEETEGEEGAEGEAKEGDENKEEDGKEKSADDSKDAETKSDAEKAED